MVDRRISRHTKINEFRGRFKNGHYCHHWTGFLHEIAQEKQSRGQEMHLIPLDCEKAFDCVSFEAILDSVDHFQLKGIIRELMSFHRLRIHGIILCLYPDRGTP